MGIKVVLFWLLAMQWCAAQNPPIRSLNAPTETGTFSNGRKWKAMQEVEKLVWLHAYREGLMAAIMASYEGRGESFVVARDLVPKMRGLYPEDLTNGEVGSALDSFYNTPENAPVPISFALQAINMKAVGVEQSKIDSFVAGSRRDAVRALNQEK
jgi:hypothetical protein